MSAEQLTAIRKHLASALGTIDVMLADAAGGTDAPEAEPADPAPVDPVPEQPTDPVPVDPAPEAPVDPVPVPDPTPAPALPGSGTPVRGIAELMTALSNAASGDVIPMSGQFPPVRLKDVRFAGQVTLLGKGAEIERFDMIGCEGLHLADLHLLPAGPVVTTSKAIPYLMTGDAATTRITVDDCDFWGGRDAPNFRSWGLAEWQAQRIGAAFFRGDHIVLDSNCALGVNFGFNLTGADCEMDDNRVCGFSADSFRACGSRFVGIGNWATDAYSISANHPDGIQAFDGSAEISDQLWRDTIIMEYSTPTDQRGAIGASLQLIGYHDGPYADIQFDRFVGSSSSFNAYHVTRCPTHIADKVMMFTVSGPSGGATRLRVPQSAALTDVYMDKSVTTGGQATGKPDYSKLAAFQVPALRGNARPDLNAILGW